VEGFHGVLLDGKRRVLEEREILYLRRVLEIDQDAESLTFLRGESRFKKEGKERAAMCWAIGRAMVCGFLIFS
jgi:hypothetical protein